MEFGFTEKQWYLVKEYVDTLAARVKFIDEFNCVHNHMTHNALEYAGFRVGDIVRDWKNGNIQSPEEMALKLVRMVNKKMYLQMGVYRLLKITVNETRSTFTKAIKDQIVRELIDHYRQ